MCINNPNPILYGFRYKPLPRELRRKVAPVFSVLAFFTVFIARTIPPTPPARDPKAERPANIGISGNTPPTLGIGSILGVRNFLLPPANLGDFRAAAKAILEA